MRKKGILFTPQFGSRFLSLRYLMRAGLCLLAGGLLFMACSHFASENSGDATVQSQPETTEQAELPPDEEDFLPDNDIAMTVRSVADAINVGALIDSADYSFVGVLTDGSGMPLFTDMDGLPGEWEIEVVSPQMVRIRNMNTGDLLPEELVEYLADALQISDGESLELVDSSESAEKRVSVFAFGRGTLTVESRQASDATGEPGPLMEITMQAIPTEIDATLPPDSVTERPTHIGQAAPVAEPRGAVAAGRFKKSRK